MLSHDGYNSFGSDLDHMQLLCAFALCLPPIFTDFYAIRQLVTLNLFHRYLHNLSVVVPWTPKWIKIEGDYNYPFSSQSTPLKMVKGLFKNKTEQKKNNQKTLTISMMQSYIHSYKSTYACDILN